MKSRPYCGSELPVGDWQDQHRATAVYLADKPKKRSNAGVDPRRVNARVSERRANLLEVVMLLQAFHRHGVPQIRWLELRDLFDLALAIDREFAKRDGVIRCCPEYLRAGDTPSTQHKFARSLRARIALAESTEPSTA